MKGQGLIANISRESFAVYSRCVTVSEVGAERSFGPRCGIVPRYGISLYRAVISLSVRVPESWFLAANLCQNFCFMLASWRRREKKNRVASRTCFDVFDGACDLGFCGPCFAVWSCGGLGGVGGRVVPEQAFVASRALCGLLRNEPLNRLFAAVEGSAVCRYEGFVVLSGCRLAGRGREPCSGCRVCLACRVLPCRLWCLV